MKKTKCCGGRQHRSRLIPVFARGMEKKTLSIKHQRTLFQCSNAGKESWFQRMLKEFRRHEDLLLELEAAHPELKAFQGRVLEVATEEAFRASPEIQARAIPRMRSNLDLTEIGG